MRWTAADTEIVSTSTLAEAAAKLPHRTYGAIAQRRHRLIVAGVRLAGGGRGPGKAKPVLHDFTGQRIGSWTVIRQRKNTLGGDPNTYWLCRCDCKKTKWVRGSHLSSGRSTQCLSCAAKKRKRKNDPLPADPLPDGTLAGLVM